MEKLKAKGKIKYGYSNIDEAIKGVDIIMVTIPAMGHYQLAKQMAPHLEDGHIIVLNPGRKEELRSIYYNKKKDAIKI